LGDYLVALVRELVLIERASFGENYCFVTQWSRWERTPMNHSTCLAVLVASAVGAVAMKLKDGWAPVLEEIEQLVGSFFGAGAIAHRGTGI
jgi:hypothetical protein